MSNHTMTSSPDTFERLKTIHCKSCGEESLAACHFCGGCGQQLQEPCLDCGENNSIDVSYCGKCGADVVAIVAAAQHTIAEAISQADNQAGTGRFQEAVAMLKATVVADHPQLQNLVDQIHRRIEQFPKQREKAIAESQQMISEVNGLLEQRKFHLAHQRLKSVLPTFRTQELRKLLENVQSKVDESDYLRTTVRKMLHDRNYADLLQQVKRLAELNPDDEQVIALLAKLQEHDDHKRTQVSGQLIKLVKFALDKSDYKSAMSAINKLPVPIQNKETLKLVQAVKERVWLAEHLRTAPYITTTVLALAERMKSLQPNDDQSRSISKKLTHRWHQAERKDLTHPISWAKSPDQTAFGLPVDFLPLPVELARTRKSPAVTCQPMLVPFGLALQAIGEAEINIDLTPRDSKPSWLKRLTRRGHKETAKVGWGINIGTTNIKAIQLVRGSKDSEIQVAQSVTYPLQNDAPEQTPCLGNTISQFLKRHDVVDQPLVISLPGVQTFFRYFDIPAPKPSKFAEAVQYEMRARIPLKEGALGYDYRWSELTATEKSVVPRRRVLLVAAKRNHIEERLQFFREAKVSRCVVQSDCLAIGNAVLHSRKIPINSNTGSLAILEIDAETSNLVVLNKSDVWFCGLYLGTNSMDQVLVNKLKIPKTKAELLRMQPHKAPCLYELHELLIPEFAALAATSRRALDQYQREVGQPIARLLLCGSGAEQHGLLRYLRLGN